MKRKSSFIVIISKTKKKSQGTQISPEVINNLINQINAKEAITGRCKGIEIVCENSSCKGTINERGGLCVAGHFSLNDHWAHQLIEYLGNLADKGELEVKQK